MGELVAEHVPPLLLYLRSEWRHLDRNANRGRSFEQGFRTRMKGVLDDEVSEEGAAVDENVAQRLSA